MTTHEQLLAEYRQSVTRRWFFQQCGVGLGSIALASLLGKDASAAAGVSGDGGSAAAASPATGSADPLAPKRSHFPAKTKRVIFLFMAGAPSHLELFDNKPEL